MTPERIKELAALSASGAMECPEAAEWARLLSEGNALAWQELAAHREAIAAALVATTPVKAPKPELKARILAQITERKAASNPADAPGTQAHREPDSSPLTQGLRSIRKNEGPWIPMPIPGLRIKMLSIVPERNYAMLYAEIDAGVRYPSHHHDAAEELYVLTGDLRINQVRLEAGDFHHAEPGSDHEEIVSEHGCTALMLVPLESIRSLMPA